MTVLLFSRKIGLTYPSHYGMTSGSDDSSVNISGTDLPNPVNTGVPTMRGEKSDAPDGEDERSGFRRLGLLPQGP